MDYEYSAMEGILSFLEDDDPDEIATEAMKKSDRDKLPNSAFADPDRRQYPINDEESLRNGIKFFRFVPKDRQELVAKNFLKAAKKMKIKIVITKGNPFEKYCKNYPDVQIVPPRRVHKGKDLPKKADVTDIQDALKKKQKADEKKKAASSAKK